MKIDYYNIGKDFLKVKNNLINNVNQIGKSGSFIEGKFLKKFESRLSKLLGSNHVIGVANGTDAIEIALKFYGFKPGSEVITVSNTFVATINAIINNNLKPVFCDIDQTLNIDPTKIEKLINNKTVAIIPVHLNGMPCCMKKINYIAKKYNLIVIEDCAQSILSKYGNNFIGNSKNICCFSMHPTKNLGAIGDAGFVSTNDKKIYKFFKIVQNHGIVSRGVSRYVGRNSRLDEIQAIYVLERLKSLKKETKKKQEIAKYYDQFLNNLKFVNIPNYGCCLNIQHTFHRYVIRVKNRKNLIKYLKKKKIDVKVHYLKLLHEQFPFKKYYKKNSNILKASIKFNKEILSLPCTPYMNKSDVKFVVNAIKNFYSKKN